MIIRSRAPLRLGFAGGGTDLPAFSDIYGGSVLNATINQYAHCTLIETNSSNIVFNASDIEISEELNINSEISLNGKLPLHRAVYKRFINDYNLRPASFTLNTYSDVPPGSGLGSSSTLVVSMIKVFSEWFNIPMGEYDIAKLAYEIERIDLGFSGGKQDQYAASFGGFNFMDFNKNGSVVINPLSIKPRIINELSENLLLYYSGISRSAAEISDSIIDEQNSNVDNKINESVIAMKATKKISHDMKNAFILGNIEEIASLMNKSWEHKKQTAQKVSNNELDEMFNLALKNNAKACKLSGAGGGGFSIFLVDPIDRHDFIRFLENYSKGYILNCEFTNNGCHSWRVK